MSSAVQLHAKLMRRLMPLYVAAFFQGFVLWYTVEKLFMTTIGFDDAGIGLMIALYSAVMLLVETPSGILADRWSRKGVLVIASLALMASSLVAGLSYSQPVFLLSSALWGVYFAMYSGTYDSIVYDTLLEETSHTKQFERYFGRVRTVDSVALVASSLAGGLLAGAFSLRTPYIVTIVTVGLSIAALAVFREPRLHKAESGHTLLQQVTTTFRAVLRNKLLLPVLIVSVLVSMLLYMLLEFSQLWLIQLQVPIVYFGLANALVLTGLGVGGLLVGWRRLSRPALLAVISVSLFLGVGALIISRNVYVIVMAQIVCCIALVAASVLFSKLLHDQLSSNIRAGAASAVSTLSRAIIIPMALLFGYISQQSNVFRASYVLLGFALICIAGMVYQFSRQTTLDPA